MKGTYQHSNTLKYVFKRKLRKSSAWMFYSYKHNKYGCQSKELFFLTLS